MHSDTADDSINGLSKELPQDSFLFSLLSPITPIWEDHLSAIEVAHLQTIKIPNSDKVYISLEKTLRQTDLNK